MKFLIFYLLSFSLSLCPAYAWVGSMWHLWRSTETTSNNTDVLVATGTIFLKDFIVVEAGIASTFQYFNTTGTVAGGVSRSSSIIYMTVNTGDIYPLDDYLTEGFRYTTTGGAKIRARWDWYRSEPKGQEWRGRKD